MSDFEPSAATLRIGFVQTRPRFGEVRRNRERARKWVEEAPPFDVDGWYAVELRFQHWLRVDTSDPLDGLTLEAIDASDNIWINRRQVDIRSVRSIIERLHAENPKGTVVIQADRDSRNDMLVQVMDASRRAGVYDIALAAVAD